jgi:hypothetical protein
LIPEELAKAADLMMEKALSVLERFVNTFHQEYEKIEKSQLLELIVTDSIPLKNLKKNSVELAPLLHMHMVHIIIPLVVSSKTVLVLEANYKTAKQVLLTIIYYNEIDYN